MCSVSYPGDEEPAEDHSEGEAGHVPGGVALLVRHPGVVTLVLLEGGGGGHLFLNLKYIYIILAVFKDSFFFK